MKLIGAVYCWPLSETRSETRPSTAPAAASAGALAANGGASHCTAPTAAHAGAVALVSLVPFVALASASAAQGSA